ncbi:MAG: DUF3656 domain-containing protein, partial [Verrucomicrobiota bacterium]
RPLEEGILSKQLSRLGGTTYELGLLTLQLEGEVMCPMSELNRMRRALVDQLDLHRKEGFENRRLTGRTVAEMLPARQEVSDSSCPELRVLCRTEDQVEAAFASDVETVYVDLEDVRRYKDLVKRVRSENPSTKLFLATPRIQKAGEAGLFKVVERANPDGVLVRNLGGVQYFRNHPDLRMVGDFSLNVANPVSARRFMDQGFENLTVSYDLNIEQVLDLMRSAPPEWFELTLHQHMPMFHMEHCVFCTFLSEGTDFTNCGRPCDEHDVQLRDRVGQLHPLKADVGCRNTLFNGRAQSGAKFYELLKREGLARFRVELLDENRVQAEEVIQLYYKVIDAQSVIDDLPFESRLGVVEGTLEAR